MAKRKQAEEHLSAHPLDSPSAFASSFDTVAADVPTESVFPAAQDGDRDFALSQEAQRRQVDAGADGPLRSRPATASSALSYQADVSAATGPAPSLGLQARSSTAVHAASRAAIPRAATAGDASTRSAFFSRSVDAGARHPSSDASALTVTAPTPTLAGNSGRRVGASAAPTAAGMRRELELIKRRLPPQLAAALELAPSARAEAHSSAGYSSAIHLPFAAIAHGRSKSPTPAAGSTGSSPYARSPPQPQKDAHISPFARAYRSRGFAKKAAATTTF